MVFLQRLKGFLNRGQFSWGDSLSLCCCTRRPPVPGDTLSSWDRCRDGGPSFDQAVAGASPPASALSRASTATTRLLLVAKMMVAGMPAA